MSIYLYNQAKSIRITPNGFSLFKKEGEKKIAKKEYPGAIFGSIPQYATEFLNLAPEENFDLIANLTPPVLVPKHLFEENSLKRYLQMQFPIANQDHLFYEEISNYYAAYYLTDEVVNNLNRLNTPYKVIHQATLLFYHLPAIQNNINNSIILTVDDADFDIILLKKNKIHLINKYHFTENTDLLYYLLNIAKQFDIVLADVNILLISHQAKELAGMVKKYFPNTETIYS